jgi:redox-sensitive bicupin YhaK (pirin superfamily)
MLRAAMYRSITRIVPAQATSDGAGVRLARTIGSARLDHLDPFLLLDEFKSDDSADYIAGFPDHPHRGFETVTYMLAGHMEHRDHMGNHGLLDAGSVQWMTAGHGIIHSEMPRQEQGLMWGFQLWVNLPARNKMCTPRYQDIPPDAVPSVTLPSGAEVRVIAGEQHGAVGPVSGVDTSPLYLDVRLPAGAGETFSLPSAHAAFAYVYRGAGLLGGGDGQDGLGVDAQHLAVLDAGDALQARAGSDGMAFLLIAGRPLGEPVARYGPFVMNTVEEIRQAVLDYQSGRLLARP